MEFSIFLLFLTIGLCLLYMAGDFVLGLAGRSRWFRFVLLILPAALFFVTRIGAILALVSLIVFIAEKETGFAGNLPAVNRTVLLTGFFLVILALTGYFYNRDIQNIWLSIDKWKEGFQTALPVVKNSRLADVYPVAQYFRFVYPVIAVILLLFLFDRELGKNRRTYWYRLFRTFDHRAVYPLVAFWTLYLVIDRIRPVWVQPVWQSLLLEAAVYFSFLYIVYGLLTIQVAMRKFRLPFIWSLAVLYLVVVASGPVFVFTLTFLMGIGVSDIWMQYRKKLFRRIAGK